MPEPGKRRRAVGAGDAPCAGPRARQRVGVVFPEEVLVLWIVLILLLALAGGFLGTLLEFALWVVVLMVIGLALLGLVIWRAVSSRAGSTGHVGRS